MTLISWSQLCWWSSAFASFNLMSRPQGDVATSFAAHFFSSSHNLSSLLQLIFLLPTFIPGHNLKVMSRPLFFFCSALLLVATLVSGRDIVCGPGLINGRNFSLLVGTLVPLFMSGPQLYVSTSNGAFHLKPSCNFVLLQRPLLWIH